MNLLNLESRFELRFFCDRSVYLHRVLTDRSRRLTALRGRPVMAVTCFYD